MRIALNRGVIWPTRVCQAALYSVWALKDWQTGVIILIHKRDRKECTNGRGFSCLSLPGKVYVICLETGCREIFEPNWIIPSANFVLWPQHYRPNFPSPASF